MRRILFVLAASLLLMIPCSRFVQAQESPPEEPALESRDERATVTHVERTYESNGNPQIVFEALGEDGETYTVDTGDSYTEGLRYDVHEGTHVILQLLPNADGSMTPYLSDVVRTKGLVWILVLFAALTLAVGWHRGLFALVGLAVTLGILFLFVFPRLLAGADPVLTTALGCIVILAVNMHLSHGFSRRTAAAFAATVAGLGLAAIFGKWFVELAHLSGLASEEAVLLHWQGTALKAPQGILLAGILLGATGVLDDIAITQGETVSELKQANPALTQRDLFIRAMRIGRHHIASTVNTLVLAYVGVAMPLFLLFLSNPNVSFFWFVNNEGVAEEVVRTLAGTMGLILTVPIATWFATMVEKDNKAG